MSLLAMLMTALRKPTTVALKRTTKLVVPLAATLEAAGWVIGGRDGAATRLGLKRTTLIYKMQRHGISRPPLDSNAGITQPSAQMPGLMPQSL